MLAIVTFPNIVIKSCKVFQRKNYNKQRKSIYYNLYLLHFLLLQQSSSQSRVTLPLMICLGRFDSPKLGQRDMTYV